jgi:DHA3 family tetracycline resistance protein-like MFS transporter
MIGQVDAVGQITGGPLIGLVANLISIPAAMTISGLLLAPAMPLIRAADRNEAKTSEISKI